MVRYLRAVLAAHHAHLTDPTALHVADFELEAAIDALITALTDDELIALGQP